MRGLIDRVRSMGTRFPALHHLANGMALLPLLFVLMFIFRSEGIAQAGSPTYVSPRVRPYVFNGDVRTLPTAATVHGGDGIQKNGGPLPTLPPKAQAPDPIRQRGAQVSGLTVTPPEFSTPSPTFDGMSGGGNPPDTNGAVGPNHYIQMINTGGAGTGGAFFAIWNKTGGLLAGAASIQSVWVAAGAPVNDDCRVRGRGDPYVIYDHLADRWVMSELANKTTDTGNPLNIECIAVSKGPNPVTDGWFAYTFDLGVSNDYPKLAVWPDGYYLITQQGYDGNNLDATVFDRANMLNGNPATFQRKSFMVGGHTIIAPPSELEGTPPPGGSPNFYLAPVDGDLFGGSDRLELFEFHVDWGVPANTTFASVQTLATAAFSSDLGSGSSLNSNDINQPGTGSQLDAATVWPRTPLHYRNFGDHESLVINHTVNASGAPDNIAGIRWYELRRTPPGSGSWSIFQQGTFAPADAPSPVPGTLSIHRWMGSIAMDSIGNIALGYNVSNDGVAPHPTVYPGMRYAGRLSTDPAGELSFGEINLANGTTSKAGGGRWGDYSAMRVDPVNGCTFWFTSQYQSDNGIGGSVQNTHIGAFRFPTCNPADLSITKSGSPTVIAGNQLTYTITVLNNGPANATNVVVTDTLPAGVSFLSSSINCTGGAVRTCNIGNLANGAQASFTIQVRVPANFLSSISASTSNITNTSSVSATESDPDSSNNTATVTTNVVEQADLRITKVCKPDGPAPATSAAYCDLIIDNLGVSDARAVVVTDALTSNAPFQVTSYVPVVACAPATPSALVTTFTATCNIGTLAAGASTTIRVNVTANVGGDINDTATVSSATPDPNTSNNQATGHITFVSVANLSITKTRSPNPVVAGTNLTYILTASNAGPSPATNVVVTDTLPAQVSVVSVTPGGGFSCSGGIPGNPAQPLICTVGTLGNAASAIITVVVKVNPSTPDGTILINNAAISSATNDPDNSNNVATANAPVVAQADLSITKTSDKPNYKPNALITFTVKVTNNGPSDALAVIVTDSLPTITQALYLSDTGGCTKSGLVLTCNMGNMPVGTNKSFLVNMTVKGNRGTITNNASVAASTPDPSAANNTASQSVGVK